MKLIESVPNFSEGRDRSVIDQIADAITSSDVDLLRVESDVDHNRSVITFVGSPEDVLEAAFQGCKKASELIRLEHHAGEHPRIGATDVIPLIPLKNVTFEECIELANQLSKRIADELSIPIYLYEKAARIHGRQNLSYVRKREFEALQDEIASNPLLKPDFGPALLGPAGATAVGVRDFLIAFNVNLMTDNLKIAKNIARSIREKHGGLPGVKALGLPLASRGIVQVSMNLTDYKKTGMKEVFDFIVAAASDAGIEVLESEIVGLVPKDALLEGGEKYMKIANFTTNLIP